MSDRVHFFLSIARTVFLAIKLKCEGKLMSVRSNKIIWNLALKLSSLWVALVAI